MNSAPRPWPPGNPWALGMCLFVAGVALPLAGRPGAVAGAVVGLGMALLGIMLAADTRDLATSQVGRRRIKPWGLDTRRAWRASGITDIILAAWVFAVSLHTVTG